MAERTTGVRELINETAAVQVETLGASVKLWGTWLDTMAWYGWEVGQSLSKILATNADANEEINHLVTRGQQKLTRLRELPDEIGREFSSKVGRRLGHPVATPARQRRARAKRKSGRR